MMCDIRCVLCDMRCVSVLCELWYAMSDVCMCACVLTCVRLYVRVRVFLRNHVRARMYQCKRL